TGHFVSLQAGGLPLELAFLNGEYGINIRRGGPAQLEERNKSLMANNVAWGNMCDFKIKSGYSNLNEIEHCAGEGWTLNGGGRAMRSLVGHGKVTWERDTIVLDKETNLNAGVEFADPFNHDYRLQATSRFRGTGPEGRDRGPYPYQANIFYVRTNGNDQADGLSSSNAWKNLPRATRGLKPGDTLYIEPGVYDGDIELSLKGSKGKPIRIMGRGHDQVFLRGNVLLKYGSHIEFDRLYFNEEVKITKGENIVFDNCQFQGKTTGLQADKVAGLRVTHCAFTGFEEAGLMIGPRPENKTWWNKLKGAIKKEEQAEPVSASSGVYLSGNLFDNRMGVAVRLDGTGAMDYSNYNSYRQADTGWEQGGNNMPVAEVQNKYDRQLHELSPEFIDENGIKTLKNPLAFAALGPLGRPIGLYRDEKRRETLSMVSPPKVHSVSATTANIEWMTTLPAICELAWGETPACANTNCFDVNRFGSFSLTGLKPGQAYYFRIQSFWAPVKSFFRRVPPADAVKISGEAISFTTLKKNHAPVVYYVAPDGDNKDTGLDRKNAWKTIQYAADNVNAGDTVLVAGGVYRERVRIRATGTSNAPITFKCMPGEKAVMDGDGKTLNMAFIVAGKNNIYFDGFYFRDSNREPLQAGWWWPKFSGEFNIHHCKNIKITRCFSDGRGGYTARFIVAWQVENLLVRNCVTMNKMSGAMEILHCPHLRLEHNVFARQLISCFILRNEENQPVIMDNNIFTDMLKKKAKANIGLFVVSRLNTFRQNNNCYVLRSFPPRERALIRTNTYTQLSQYIINPLFADPGFAGDPSPTNTAGFPPDRMMNPGLKLDFNSFFATNPEVVKRRIGLQPEAFSNFNFNAAKK
ncbi:chondroitinase-B domain-containing protein, partial [Verrucomicrobiota bacterium]